MQDLLNGVQLELSKSHNEQKKVTAAAIRAESHIMEDKREERIKNLMKQAQGVQANSGPCFKIVKVLAMVMDFVMAPITMSSMKGFSMQLTQCLKNLEEAKKQGKILGLQINGQQIDKMLTDLKSLFQGDTSRLKEQESQHLQEMERIMTLLEEIHVSLEEIPHNPRS